MAWATPASAASSAAAACWLFREAPRLFTVTLETVAASAASTASTIKVTIIAEPSSRGGRTGPRTGFSSVQVPVPQVDLRRVGLGVRAVEHGHRDVDEIDPGQLRSVGHAVAIARRRARGVELVPGGAVAVGVVLPLAAAQPDAERRHVRREQRPGDRRTARVVRGQREPSADGIPAVGQHLGVGRVEVLRAVAVEVGPERQRGGVGGSRRQVDGDDLVGLAQLAAEPLHSQPGLLVDVGQLAGVVRDPGGGQRDGQQHRPQHPEQADADQDLDQGHAAVAVLAGAARRNAYGAAGHRASSARQPTAPIVTETPDDGSTLPELARTGWVAIVTTPGSVTFAAPVAAELVTLSLVSDDQDAM